MNRHFLLYVGRALFAGLFLFEFLNWIGLLHFSLEFTWLGLLITSGAIWAACEVVAHRFPEKDLPPRSLGLAFIGAALPVYADALADINRLYGSIPTYDNYLHFLGGVAVAGLITLVMYTYAKRDRSSFRVSRTWLAWISFLISLALGVLYEFEEYLEDFFTGSQRSGGGPDTAGDLLFDAMGAALVIITVWLIWRARKKKK